MEPADFLSTQPGQAGTKMETVVGKFQHSGKYNLVAPDIGMYGGFVSRANVLFTLPPAALGIFRRITARQQLPDFINCNKTGSDFRIPLINLSLALK